MRLDQINELVGKHDIQGAIEMAETIDWRRIKSIRTLCMVADIYEAGKMYEESKAILLLAYNRSSVGKAILYRLVEISVKLDQIDDAVEYYTEYSKNARGDSAKYLLKYKIYRARRAPLEEQAEILDKYKSKEYTERWAFELARLYDRMGEKDKCIEECDDLILWFSEGKYVAKAMELKMKYEPLTAMQQKGYQAIKATVAPEETLRMEAEEAGDDGLGGLYGIEGLAGLDSVTARIEEEESAKERTERMQMVAKAAIEKRNEEAVVNRNAEDLQDKLANSFRDVLSGFNRTKDNIIEESEPVEVESQAHNDDGFDQPVSEDEYSVVKDLEPEDISSAQDIQAAKLSEMLAKDSKEVEAKPTDNDDINKIISEMNSAMASDVGDIQSAPRVSSDTQEMKMDDIRTLTINSDVPIEEQILREDTKDEKRKRVLIEGRPDKLSEEQKNIFTYFAKVPGMDQQLLDALHGSYRHVGERTSENGNIVIMGSRGTGKTKLFEGVVKAFCKDMGIEAIKVARIGAEALNAKDPAEVIAKMSGGFLLIEEAGKMSKETIEKLSKALGFRTDRLIVVIEDEKESMRKMLAEYKGFAGKFKTVISIPIFTNDELVTFARTYANEKGYKVEEMGVLALYDLIGGKQSERDPITIDGVRELMDKAMENTKKVGRKFGRKIAVRNTDEDGLTLIYEKDFD
jgi:hypothetical protein